MARIVVLGGTGYAGSNIVAVAAGKGHEVVSYSRTLPATRVEGVNYQTGDVLESSLLEQAVVGADVVVSALSPRGALEGAGKLRSIEGKVAELAAKSGVRFGVVGGAGSLLVAEGGPKVAETDGFPDGFKAEAAELAGVLDDLRASDESLDWFFVSPAGGFGAWVPGEATGVFRVGGDVLLVDANGDSSISGADLALAIVNEIETPAHRRARFTVAY
ncbi:NAD(P)-dependent oxidoreductase [Changpingibacter yushuensis]|uniref:NAD(P)-dependent oxidoreductase n=1 Tax=Changpingibacter yushuensis TaxID=2758440 RepID=UPI00165DA6DE|nr:NAD(P)H-binding protein [Changpingibacter yushuensis]